MGLLVRTGWFRAVHVKSEESHRLWLIGGVTDCMLRAWSALWSEYKRLHALLIWFVGHDELCRRFVAISGVGPVTALSFKAAVDDPTRFAKSKTVGAHFGLTVRRIQSGDTIDIEGHISKCGDGEVRTALYEAASAMLVRSKKWCAVKAWGVKIAAKRGHKRAVVAVARKLAVIMHRMWIDGSEFRFAAHETPERDEKGSPHDVGDRIVNAPQRQIETCRNDKATTH